MAPKVRPPASSAIRRLLAAGAIVTALGLALVGGAHADIGGTFVLGGWALLGVGIHRFGRRGDASRA